VVGVADGRREHQGAERVRADLDAQRNVDALLEAAKTVFATSGVDAPAKEIADLAGVGVGTLYDTSRSARTWSWPCFTGGSTSAPPGAGVERRPRAGGGAGEVLDRYTEFVGTKRGLATALHSGDPAFDALPGYFMERLEPVLGALLDAAVATGEARADVSAKDLMHAIARCAGPCAARRSSTTSAWSPCSPTGCAEPDSGFGKDRRNPVKRPLEPLISWFLRRRILHFSDVQMRPSATHSS
jgi:hypothetical protein